MNRGRKHLILPSVWGAILLEMIAPSYAAGQRGGGLGGGDYTSIGRGAAGLDRSVPAQEPTSSANCAHDRMKTDSASAPKLALGMRRIGPLRSGELPWQRFVSATRLFNFRQARSVVSRPPALHFTLNP